MPHLAGGSVHDALLEGYRFSVHQAIGIATDTLDGLAYVHREFGAIHRDTKPGNILLDARRRHGYLSDFGSAALLDDAGGAAAVLGTNLYQPPEARPTGRVGIDADLYGVAMTLFEMLNSRLPWETLRLAEVEARLGKGLRAVSDSFLAFKPHVPPRLRTVVRAGLQRSPAERFRSAVSADASFVAESEIIANAEARLLEVLKNPMAFTGHDPSRLLAQLVQGAKDAGWRVADVKSGEGIRIYRPGSGDTDVIRLMKSGQQGAPRDTMQAGPRLVVSRSRALQHVPLKGNPTLK